MPLPKPVKPELTDKSLMPFGIHKGAKMIDVPARYLIYIYETYYKGKQNEFTEPFSRYVINNMDILKKEASRC